MSKGTTSLPPRDPGGRVHVFSHSVIEIKKVSHWGKVLLLPRRSRLWGVAAQPCCAVREIIFENCEKLHLPTMRRRGDPRNGRSAITLVWQCRARLAGAFELERESASKGGAAAKNRVRAAAPRDP